MRLSDSRFPVRGVLAAAVLGFGLAAFALIGGSYSGSGWTGLFGSGAFAATVGNNTITAASGTPGTTGALMAAGSSQAGAPDPSLFLDTGYCPPVEIRPGTEALPIYVRGHEGDDAFVRFQGSITKTARECHTNGDTLTIKVGIAGRLTAGPKGAPGNYTLPLRIAVVKQHGNKVFYSQVSRAPVSISAPNYASDFSQVVDNISFQITPDDHDLIIFVGYDEGKPKPPAPTG